MTAFPAMIVPLDADGRPDNSLPGGGGHPWFPGHVGGGYPSTGPVVPPSGNFPAYPPHPWLPGALPQPPLVIGPGDPEIDNSLPIQMPHPWLPGHGNGPIWSGPAQPIHPVVPSHPIVLPPVPATGALALVLPVQTAEPKEKPDGVPDGSTVALIWFGPGTVPTVAWIAPAAAPK